MNTAGVLFNKRSLTFYILCSGISIFELKSCFTERVMNLSSQKVSVTSRLLFLGKESSRICLNIQEINSCYHAVLHV